MAVVETEKRGQIMIIALNRPERMNALGVELRTEMAKAFTEFQDSKELEVAILTGRGRAFCAGEDMKESLQAIRTVLLSIPESPEPETPEPVAGQGSQPA